MMKSETEETSRPVPGRWLAGLAGLALLIATDASGARHSAAALTLAGADTTTITIRTYATALAFDPDVISVKAGTVVRIRYVNESTMAHNLVIVRTDDDIDTLGPAAYDAGATGFVPMQHKERMIAFTPLASPGKTVEVTFVAPPAGEYPFVCLVDGHFNVMLGTLASLGSTD
jgi:plastocyanin